MRTFFIWAYMPIEPRLLHRALGGATPAPWASAVKYGKQAEMLTTESTAATEKKKQKLSAVASLINPKHFLCVLGVLCGERKRREI